ncbi:dTDP-4-dehydrorhamnose reductase [Kluyvera sp. 142486]|uniref:dTDP-4-dehydrorhamnose reductase n=1 Tax=Kluyvera sp. 142486 TaxID=3390050 RepID=UPI003980D082
MKILLTGIKGQLGQSFTNKIPNEWSVISADKNTLDVGNEINVHNVVSEIRPDVIINAAACTSVDAAESDIDGFERVNHLGAKYIAQAAEKYKSKLIHLSTDYVFDGKSTEPYKETSATNPLNIYGKTKLYGELAVLANHQNAIIIRTSWVYSEYGQNFLKTILGLLSKNIDIRVVGDQIGAPTYAPDLAKLIIDIIRDDKLTPGVFHYCGDTIMSWYDFSCEISKRLGYTGDRISCVSSDNYKTAAVRPPYSVLNCEKLESLGYNRSGFSNGIKQSINNILNAKAKI